MKENEDSEYKTSANSDQHVISPKKLISSSKMQLKTRMIEVFTKKTILSLKQFSHLVTQEMYGKQDEKSECWYVA